MSSEQFSLSWDDFHKTLSSGMNSLFESEHLVDVTLAVEGQYLKAHKIVLSVCSTYFRTLFTNNPCKHPIVFLKDVSYDVMNYILTFIYKGEVQVGQEYLANFIATAEALQIKGLTNNDSEKNKLPENKKSKRFHNEESKQKKVTCPSPKRVKLIESTPTDFPIPSSLVNSSSSNSFQPVVSQKFETSISSSEITTECVQLQPKMEPLYGNENELVESTVFDESQGEIYTEEIYQENMEDEGYSFFENKEPKPGASNTNETQVKALNISTKGKRKNDMPRYIVDGFVFHINIIKGSPPMTYLRCLEYKRLGCHARAVIPNNGTINDIKVNQPHNHPPDYAAEERIVFLRKLKSLVLKNENITCKQVYDFLSPSFPNAAKNTPFSSVKDKMNRWKKKTIEN